MRLFVGKNGKCFFNTGSGSYFVPQMSVHVYLKIHMKISCHQMRKAGIIEFGEDVILTSEELLIHPVIGIQMMEQEMKENVKPKEY